MEPEKEREPTHYSPLKPVKEPPKKQPPKTEEPKKNPPESEPLDPEVDFPRDSPPYIENPR